MSDLTKTSLISDESTSGEIGPQAKSDLHDSVGPSTTTSERQSEIPVTYIFETKWTTSDQSVLGLMGRDRQSAIAIAREAFDELNGVSDHRITFHAQFLQRDRLNEPPVRLMDAVWGQLANKPPKYIRVRIKETPKDKSEDRTNGLILGSICVAIVAILVFISIS